MEFKTLTNIQLQAKIDYHKELIVKMEAEIKNRQKRKRKKINYVW